MSNPPVLRGLPSRSRPGGLLTPRCLCRDVSRIVTAISAPFVRVVMCVHAADLTALSTHILRTYARCFGHHIVSVELCSEGSSCVMAEEARPMFSIDQTGRRAYREILVGARAPSPKSNRRGVLQSTLSELRCGSLNNQLTHRAHARAISASDFKSRASLFGVARCAQDRHHRSR